MEGNAMKNKTTLYIRHNEYKFAMGMLLDVATMATGRLVHCRPPVYLCSTDAPKKGQPAITNLILVHHEFMPHTAHKNFYKVNTAKSAPEVL